MFFRKTWSRAPAIIHGCDVRPCVAGLNPFNNVVRFGVFLGVEGKFFAGYVGYH